MRMYKNAVNPLHRKTMYVVDNLYQSVKTEVTSSDKVAINRVHFAPSIYTGDLTTIIVRSAYYPLTTNPDFSFFFNVNPNATDFKTLYVYQSGVGYKYEDFDDYINFVLNGGATSSGGGTSGMTPEIQQYIDTKVMQAEAVIVGNDSITPLATIANLLAMTTMTDKRLMFVEETNSIYAYDAQATNAIDNDFILPSATGIGRWRKTTPQLISGGSF